MQVVTGTRKMTRPIQYRFQSKGFYKVLKEITLYTYLHSIGIGGLEETS